MFALYKISTNTVIQRWDTLPSEIIIKEDKITAFGPSEFWSYGDYKLIPVIQQEGGKHHLSVSDSYSETITFLPNTQPQLLVTITYKDPPLEEAKTALTAMVLDTATTVDIDYLAVLEAYEIKADKVQDRDVVNYPIHSVMVHKTVGNNTIKSMTEAVTATLDKFKKDKKKVLQIRSDQETKLAAINAANTVADALAAYSNDPLLAKYKKNR